MAFTLSLSRHVFDRDSLNGDLCMVFVMSALRCKWSNHTPRPPLLGDRPALSSLALLLPQVRDVQSNVCSTRGRGTLA